MPTDSLDQLITTNKQFEADYIRKVRAVITRDPVDRGPAHATRDQTMALTHELMHVRDVIEVPETTVAWQTRINPNLPWAEDHFAERVSGKPLNPAPSESWWPFARAGNAEHKKDEQFSHTYPERFWPRMANPGPAQIEHSTRSVDGVPHVGIRFEYGDLDDLVHILLGNPNSRQAYLPIWFPEDLAAANLGERVPCSMGYHFIRHGASGALDCVYSMRSCDVVRFYRDDIYMAGRLLQWVSYKAGLLPGNLVVNIDNLHCFPGDVPFLDRMYAKLPKAESPRSNYNFDALY